MRKQDDVSASVDGAIGAIGATRSVNPLEGRPAAGVLRGTTVLVVDDDPRAAELLGELLTTAGATVTTATSVTEAIAVVKQRRPHLIISDIGMPERDGYQLMKVIRTLSSNEGGHTPAIALTGLARPEVHVRALLSGFQAHLTKPAQMQQLIATIAKLLSLPSS